jgi:hypothetical protein
LTVRHASEVDKESFDSLDPALAEARARAAQVLSEGGLGPINALRDFDPGDRVHARIELSEKGLLKRATGGIDIKGDGSIVPFAGEINKRPIEAGTLDEAIDRLREALTG